MSLGVAVLWKFWNVLIVNEDVVVHAINRLSTHSNLYKISWIHIQFWTFLLVWLSSWCNLLTCNLLMWINWSLWIESLLENFSCFLTWHWSLFSSSLKVFKNWMILIKLGNNFLSWFWFCGKVDTSRWLTIWISFLWLLFNPWTLNCLWWRNRIYLIQK